MSILRAIIFDVDGTLAETERDGHRVAFNRAFAQHGLSWRWDEALYGRLLAVTGGKERMRFYIEEFGGTAIGDAQIADIHATKTELFQRMVRDGEIELRSGVTQLIDGAADQGLQLAVATTTSPGNVEALFGANLTTAQADNFTVIAAGDSVANKKPAPDIYLSALAQLQRSADQCIAIEDSAVGLAASTAAGIATVVTPSFYTRSEDFSAAARVVGSLDEITIDTLQTLVSTTG